MHIMCKKDEGTDMPNITTLRAEVFHYYIYEKPPAGVGEYLPPSVSVIIYIKIIMYICESHIYHVRRYNSYSYRKKAVFLISTVTNFLTASPPQ